MIATGVTIEYEDKKPVRFYITFAGGDSTPEQRIQVPSEEEGWKGCALINKGQTK